MSQFPTTTKDLIDDAVRRSRASTPVDAVNKRAVPRMSIDEINATDWDTLREKYLTTRRDDRGPVTRFLDAIDAPRNQILAALAPALERKARESGDTAAFGTGRVSVRDVLGELGMAPGVVRGVLGFVGDVAFDPLTYAGPAGWGAKVVTQGGKGVRLGIGAQRAVKQAQKAVKSGGTIKDDVVREVYEAAGRPENIREAVFGSAKSGGGPLRKAGRAVSRAVGGDKDFSGGLIAKYADQAPLSTMTPEAQRITKAVQALVAKHGAGAGPGIKIGRDASGKLKIGVFARGQGPVGSTSGIAHIPFTDIQVGVPGFTAAARVASESARLAREVGRVGTVDPAQSIRLAQVYAGTDEVEKAEKIISGVGDAERRFREENADAISVQAPWAMGQLDEFAATRASALGSIRSRMDDLTRLRYAEEKGTANPLSVLALKPKMDEFWAKANVAMAKAKDLEEMRNLRSALRSAENDRVRRVKDAAIAQNTTITEGELAVLEERTRKWDRSNLTEENRRLLDLSDDEASMLADEAEAARRLFNATTGAALATRGSAMAFLGDDQAKLLGLQKMFLGTADGITGVSSMTPMKTVSDAMFGDDSFASGVIRNVDARMRRMFGGDTGAAGDAVRAWDYARTEGSRRRKAEYLVNALRDLKAITAGSDLVHMEDEIASLMMAKLYKSRGGGFVHLVDPVSGTPTKMMNDLDRAVKAGLLNESLHPGLSAALDQFVAKHGDNLLRSVTEAELGADVLTRSQIRGVYIPNVATSKAREFIATAKKSVPDSGEPQAVQQARMAGLESFEKPRTSDSAAFDSKVAGGRVEVFNADRWTQSLSDAQIDEIAHPERREEIRRLRDILNEYDALPERPPMMANDPVRIGELLAGGRFQALVGTNSVPGGLFDGNLLTALASRLGMSERAMARQQFESDVLPNVSLLIDAAALRNAINKFEGGVGAKVPLGDGSFGTVVKLSNGRNGIRVGSDTFRALDHDVAKQFDNPIVSFMGDTSMGALYHERVAEAIEGVARTYNDQEWLRAMDWVTNQWKTITLMHPSWTIGNMIGDSVNMATNDPGFVPSLRKFYKQAVQVLRARFDPERLAKIKLNVNGQEITGADVWDLTRSEVTNSSLMSESAIGRASEGDLLGSRLSPIRESITREAIGTDFRQALDANTVALGAGDWRAKSKAALGVAGDRYKRWVVEPWYRMNTLANDAMRIVGYLSLRDHGFDHPSAVNRLIRGAFDYQRMTGFERGVARRLMPFWAWFKNNSVYQAKLLMERPIYAGALPNLQAAVEESIAGEERVPIPFRPKWMQEQLALQFGADPQSRSAVMIGNWLPQEGALMLGRSTQGVEGVQDTLRQLVSSLNPVVRVPLELGFGREAFSGRSIAPGVEGDITPVGHALSQIRPIREAGKIARAVSEQGAGAAIGRAFIGGRLQPLTDERLHVSKSREYQEQEGRLRKAIRSAEFKGDKAASVARRAELLKLYEDMVRMGFEAEVPRWAKDRLATLAQ